MEYYLPKETGFAQNDTAGVLKKIIAYIWYVSHILEDICSEHLHPQTLGSVSHHYLDAAGSENGGIFELSLSQM